MVEVSPSDVDRHRAVVSLASGLGERSGPLDWMVDGTQWPNRERSRFVAAGALSWHIQRWAADGPRPRALMLHGTAASTHSWATFAPRLAERFDVLAPDLPGHGFTSLPERARDLSLPAMADAVGRLIEAEGFEPDVAIGHSAGAAILARMCLDERIAPRVVIGLNAALLPFGSLGRYMFPAMARLLFQNALMPWLFSRQARDRANVERLIAGTGSHLTAGQLDYYVRLFRSPVHLEAALGMMANWDLPGLERDLPKLRTPLVLVAASEDEAVRPEKAFDVAERVRMASVRYVRGLGHLAHEEDAEQIARLVFEVAGETGAAACGSGKAD